MKMNRRSLTKSITFALMLSLVISLVKVPSAYAVSNMTLIALMWLRVLGFKVLNMN